MTKACETLEQRWRACREPDQYGPVPHPRRAQWLAQWARCLTLETIYRLGAEILDPRCTEACP